MRRWRLALTACSLSFGVAGCILGSPRTRPFQDQFKKGRELVFLSGNSCHGFPTHPIPFLCPSLGSYRSSGSPAQGALTSFSSNVLASSCLSLLGHLGVRDFTFSPDTTLADFFALPFHTQISPHMFGLSSSHVRRGRPNLDPAKLAIFFRPLLFSGS